MSIFGLCNGHNAYHDHSSYCRYGGNARPVRHNNDEKMKLNLDNKKFKSLSNSENGEVSDSTIFHYHQTDNMIWAEYSGGDII